MSRRIAIGLMGLGFTGLGLVPNGYHSVKPVPADLLSLVPKPTDNIDIVKGTDPDPIKDTVPLIQKLVKRQLWQGKKLAARLKGNSLDQTVRNFWDFIFNHIQYTGDGDDEVIRSLRRLVYDGKGDCDCFTTALSNLLLNAKIPHFLRVAEYDNSDEWSHIYIVVPRDGNLATEPKNYITLDCVVHRFNYEVPFTDKKDFAMRLIALDGFGCSCSDESNQSNKPWTNIKQFMSGRQLYNEGLIPAEEVLIENKIPYVVNEDQSLSVQTANGEMVVEPVLNMADTDQVVAILKAPVQQEPEPELVEAEVSETETEGAVKASGGFIFGLAAFSLLCTALRPKKATAPLTGPPKKTLETLIV